jgi:sulfate permease, SulP family
MKLEHILSATLAGLVSSLMTLIMCVSFAALIFSGVMAPHISLGLSIAIASSVIAGTILAYFSACRPLVSLPDDDSIPVMALLVTLIVASLPVGITVDAMVVTVLASIASASLLTGTILTILGTLKLGDLVRFLPYSVMGGYFAGAGLLLVFGAFRVATNLPIATLFDIRELQDLQLIWRWLLSLAIGGLLYGAMGYWSNPFTMPGCIAFLTALFFGIAFLLGYSPTQLLNDGWLLGPFSQGRPELINPVLSGSFSDVQWSSIAANFSTMGTITVLGAISLMLTVSGLSLLHKETIDINRELNVAGIANIASGLAGGLVVLPSMTLSSLATDIGGPRSRLVGLLVSFICLLFLVAGMSLVAWMPKVILAGLLIYMGWKLVQRWLLKSYSQLPRFEYLIVVLILLVVATFGFLDGVFIGLVCAIFLFVFNYSRIDVVRYALTGAQLTSNVERNFHCEEFLRKSGDNMLILKLQGYLFFGTVASLSTQVNSRLENAKLPPLRYLVLDFAEVSDIDSSAAMSFLRIAQEGAKSNFYLVMTGMPSEMQEHLRRSGFNFDEIGIVKIENDLDHGIEWCEEHLLLEQTPEESTAGVLEQIAECLPCPGDIELLATYFERRQVLAGDILVREGDPSHEMFLLETCTASVFLGADLAIQHRIRRAGTGTVFGEVGFYLDVPRTASVEIDSDGEVLVINRAANALLETEQPQLAAEMHKFMLRLVTRRLQLTTDTLRKVLA